MSSTAENQRVNFASIKNQFPYPDFLEVQLKSFQDFLQLDTPPEKRKKEGLYKVFAENFPIADTRNNFVLEFLDYYIDPPRYTIDECIARGLTYSVPLKAKLKLYCTDPDHEDFDTVIQDVYLGPIPYMTERGTFVINGAERVVVSQLHRSPGVFFGQSTHANGTKLYSARIIPFKGSWIEFATDINNVMYAYIDRKKKLPVTTLLRAIGFESDKDILEIFNLAEEVKVSKANLKKLIGRKLAARVLKTWVEDFVDEDTGEVVSIERNDVIIDRESVLDSDNIEAILESGTQNILLHREDQNLSDYAIIYNTLQKDPSNSEKEAVLYIYRQLRNAEPADEASAREVIQNLFFSEKRYDLGEVGRYRINKKLNLTTSDDIKVLTKEDIIEIIKYLIELINSKAIVDDIDHLSNRRVRTVGEQLYNVNAAPKLLMSGDHGRENYDEVNTMKNYAINDGIPSEDIFMDHAGFETYDSMYRAKKIFGAKKVVIVSQKYHLYRSLYIAKKMGLDAYGVSSDLRYYSKKQYYREAREWLARVKSFIKCIAKPEPKYLGDSIDLKASGDVTND